MARPDRVFLIIPAVAACISTLAFTIAPLFRIQVAGPDNLKLVGPAPSWSRGMMTTRHHPSPRRSRNDRRW